MTNYPELLKDLSNLDGISGDEGRIRNRILAELGARLPNHHIDSMGNLLAHWHGTDAQQRPRIMLAAHMDEVGFMVTGYDSDGSLHFASVGGISDQILPGLRVRVGTEKPLGGVIMWTPIHKNRDTNIKPMSNLRIDIGATSKGEAQGKAPLGTPIMFETAFSPLGALWSGKALDDRAGCSALVDVLGDAPYGADVLVAFTVQEEVGLRGAKVAAKILKPDVAFILETTTAHDLPNPHASEGEDQPNPTCRVGEGVALTVMDGGTITPPQLLRFVEQTAQQHGIRYQYKTSLGGRTDGATIQSQLSGIPTMTFSIPSRYIHTPTALIAPSDYASMVALVKAVLHTLTLEAIRPL